MSAHVLISGTLFRSPEERTGRVQSDLFGFISDDAEYLLNEEQAMLATQLARARPEGA